MNSEEVFAIKIQKIVLRYIHLVAVFMALILITFAVVIQVIREQDYTRTDTLNIFDQVERLLNENTTELEEVEAEYTDECLKNAETIAYIIESDPTVLDDIEELRHIAEITNVDEIHLFNEQGVIYNGTHPEYYNMSVNDGEQIGFFKQMLNDKSLKLVQELGPNTSNGSMTQYSAVWSRGGKFFVQVGMAQQNVQRVTEKNELSYIFSLLRVNSNVELYAVNKENGEIIGSTIAENAGKTLNDVGISLEKAISSPSGFHTRINGKLYFCMFEEYGDNYLGRVISFEGMYRSVISVTMILAFGIVIMALIMVFAVTRFINKEMIAGIHKINNELAEISSGNLDTRVDLQSCAEFSELSEHINDMIAVLLSETDKLSYILNKAELQIGVYEYNENMKTVRFTEKLAKILSLKDDEVSALSKDCTLFKEFIRRRIFDKVPDEEKIYRLDGEPEKYVKFEEYMIRNSTMGIIVDVTDDYNRRRRLESERDIDILTGLLNRSGLERRLKAMFASPDKLGFGALVMIDADGLKQINDKLGHDAGDIYLKSIGKALCSFGEKNSICARQGGDEYVLFLFGYESAAEVDDRIQRLSVLQNERTAKLNENETVHIRFSFGAEYLDGSGDYASLLKAADEKMYENKRRRKSENMEAAYS